MERVTTCNGEVPILLIAPHGNEDKNTDYLVEKIAEEMEAFAVINRGWKRDKNFNYSYDRANCNNVPHIHNDVIRDEFLNPILRMVAKIKKNIDKKVYIFNIHGCSDDVKVLADDSNLDLILGYGEGSPSSYSCDLRIKDAFASFLENESFGVYEGKKKGKYSGRSKNNLNQLFRIWYPDSNVHSIQIEIVKELRDNEEMLQITSDGLIGAIDDLLIFDDATSVVKRKPKYI